MRLRDAVWFTICNIVVAGVSVVCVVLAQQKLDDANKKYDLSITNYKEAAYNASDIGRTNLGIREEVKAVGENVKVLLTRTMGRIGEVGSEAPTE
jgi:hypothetical protein